VRSILEPEAMVAAAPHIDAGMIARLREMLSEMRSLTDQNASEDYGRLNRHFHTFILNKAPNKKLVSLVMDLWGQADRGRLVYKKGPGFLDESMRQHTEIVDAIEDKDLARLRRLTASHSQYGLNAVRSLAAELPSGSTKEQHQRRRQV
jgi:DNA-binding GntR family transcriptional regulator